MPRVTGFPRVGFPSRGHTYWFVSSVGTSGLAGGGMPRRADARPDDLAEGGARAHSRTPDQQQAPASLELSPATPIPQDPGGLPRLRAKAPVTRSAGSSRNKGSALRLRELLQTRQVLDEQLLGRIEVAEADRSRSGVACSPTPCTPSRSPLTGRRRRQPPDRHGNQLHRRARHRPVPHDNPGFRPGLRVCSFSLCAGFSFSVLYTVEAAAAPPTGRAPSDTSPA